MGDCIFHIRKALGAAGKLAALLVSMHLSVSAFASTSPLTRAQLAQEINDSQNLWSLGQYQPSNPDYVVQQSVKAFKAYRKGQVKQAKEILEKLFVQNKFEIPQKIERISSNHVSIGTYGNFSLWRDLAYITMARIFYEENDLARSEVLFMAVPKGSPFFQMAQIELAWTFIKAKKVERLGAVRKNLKAGSFEHQLIESYELLQSGNYSKGIPILENLGDHNLQTNNKMRDRFLLHGYFLRFIEEKPKKDFQTNVFRAKELLKRVGKAGIKNSTPEISYLVAETYWHLASLYRIEDPEKFLGLSKEALLYADEWLSPWFQVSVKGEKPKLPEEALFLSAIILWEAEQDSEAIARLKKLPVLFPSGEYLEDAYQILGDYYFEKKRFSTALGYFRKLVSVGKPQKAAYGTYKSGWCFYNLKQKFKALRHFQRLTRYYRGIEEKGETLPAGSLRDEARKDMMIMLAELTSFDEALKELKIFSFSGETWITAVEELIEFYSKLGRFSQAVAGYQWLLNQHVNDSKSWSWLSQLSRSLLANGQRLQISGQLEKYIQPVIKVVSSKNKEKLLSEIEKLILTIHKEARKTDDPQIFKATDQLYGFWQKIFFDLKRGQFYYFGAQRMQRRGELWEAVLWYKKSSEDENFKNHIDAGLSAMNIIIERADQESLKKKANLNEWQKIFIESQWVYRNKILKEQKLNISRYLFEAANHLGQHDFIKREMPSLLKEKGFSSRFAFLYFEENKRKYAKKEYELAHSLTDEVLKMAKRFDSSRELDKFVANLQEILQESAFQEGFSGGSQPKPGETGYREWYEKAISYQFNKDVQFRAWHNLMISYSEKENDLFFEKLKDFEKSMNPQTLDLSFEQKGLLTAIYRKESQIYEKSKKWVGLFESLKKLYPLVDQNLRKTLGFRLIVLAPLLNRESEFRSYLTSYVQAGYPLTTDQMEYVSRSFLWLKNREESLAWLKKIMEKVKKPDSSVALLVRDHILLHDDPHKTDSTSRYFKGQFRKLKDQALLLTSWHRVLNIIAFGKFKEIKTPQLDRLPASTAKDPAGKLQERVARVTKLLQKFEGSRKSLYKLTRHWSPRVKEKALCSTGLLTEFTSKQLNQLKEPAIDHPQFKDFVAQIDAKSLELVKEKEVEDEECSKQKEANRYLADINSGDSLFVCQYLQCKDQSLSSEFVAPERLDMDAFYKLMANQQTRALADDLSRTQSDKDFQSIQLIFTRLLKGDLWNARQLWQSLAKTGQNKHKESLSLLGALIARAAGDISEMEKLLGQVSPGVLQGIEKRLFERLSQSLSQAS